MRGLSDFCCIAHVGALFFNPRINWEPTSKGTLVALAQLPGRSGAEAISCSFRRAQEFGSDREFRGVHVIRS